MPVVTPPFDSRRVQQKVVDVGPAASGEVIVAGVEAGDVLASVLAFTAGVPSDVTSGFTITGDNELTYDDSEFGDLSGSQLVLLAVLKSYRSGPSGTAPSGLIAQLIYGLPWAGDPIDYPITAWMDATSHLYAVLSWPMSDTDVIMEEVTANFALSTGGILRAAGNTGTGPQDDDDNRALLVLWSRDGDDYDLTITTGSGTTTGVDVPISGVSPSDDLMGAVAFEDGQEMVQRTSEYVPGTNEFVKAAGTDETGNTILFAFGDETVDGLYLRMSVGTGDVDGAVDVTGVTASDEIYALIYTNAEAVDPSVVSNGPAEIENTIAAVSGGFTVTPNDLSSPPDYTGRVFLVLWKDVP